MKINNLMVKFNFYFLLNEPNPEKHERFEYNSLKLNSYNNFILR